MANVNIKFNGKEFLLSCEDGQEDHLVELSEHLDKKYSDLKNSLGNIGENKLLLITSIKIMDEYFEINKKIAKQKTEVINITERFKELKSLVYDYKHDKEKEIINLRKEQESFQTEINYQKVNYENLVDKATLEIENFIKKYEVDKKIQ
tara:strand:+ start:28 stop:474 length:447 start_codon:yes stop_codon:yes gene_type:complete